jgi:methionyl-tRNA formyltransferase
MASDEVIMRIVLCGSGDFGIPTLEALLAVGHEVAALVTQPARPAGRGGKVRHTPLAQAATQANLPVMEVAKINSAESVAAIRELAPQAIVVVAFGQMVRQAVRSIPPLGAFNLHASVLPELRGAAPINWALIRGYKNTGVTTFSLVDALDAGPVYLQAELEICPAETIEDIKPRLAQLGAKLVCDTLLLLASGQAQPQPQDDSKATLAPMLKKSDGIIDWSAPANNIHDLIHGTWPWPAAQSVFVSHDRHLEVEIARASVVEGSAGGEPGVVGADLTIATGSGTLQIVRLQPAGKRVMDWKDFVNGYRVKPGDRFVQKQ